MTADEVYRKKNGLKNPPKPQIMKETPSLKKLGALLEKLKEEANGK